MVEKVGRNDLCPCGSGKKYKNCCLEKKRLEGASFGKRKFTAKVLSGGGAYKVQQPMGQEQQASKPVDYATLMERSFGESLHAYEEKPPVPSDPSVYLAEQSEIDASEEEEKKDLS